MEIDIMKLKHPPRNQVGKRGHHKKLLSFSFRKMESQLTSPFAMTLQFLQVITQALEVMAINHKNNASNKCLRSNTVSIAM